jgi:hypothetical protein
MKTTVPSLALVTVALAACGADPQPPGDSVHDAAPPPLDALAPDAPARRAATPAVSPLFTAGKPGHGDTVFLSALPVASVSSLPPFDPPRPGLVPLDHALMGTPEPADSVVPERVSPVLPSESLAPPVVSSFDGPSASAPSPPDPHGAVSPDHVVTVVNARLLVHDRNGRLLRESALTDFWSLRLAGDRDVFDPRVVYIPALRRFVAVAAATRRSTGSKLLVAMSNSADPTGGWCVSDVPVGASMDAWVDYPTLGYNAQWITVAANLFRRTTDAWDRARVWAFRPDTLATCTSLDWNDFDRTDSGTIVPAVTLDGTATEYLATTVGSGFVRIDRIEGSRTAPSYAVGSRTDVGFRWGTLTGAASNLGAQSGTSQRIDVGDSRVHSVVSRAGLVWAANTLLLPESAPDHAAVAWYRFNTAGELLGSGSIEDAAHTTSVAYPSLAVNVDGDMLLSWAQFGPTAFGGSGYYFRSRSLRPDPTGYLHAGSGTSVFLDTRGRNRWGDYSATVVDPRNDRDYWVLQQHAAGSRWGTSWSFVRPSACVPSTETCDGLDNDCDGATDEGLTASCYYGPAGTAGVGLCRAGSTACVSGRTSACVGQTLPAAELCDGHDNDCDGRTDEDLSVGAACSVGVGECRREGSRVCASDRTNTACSVTPGAPSAERCDGRDNDCDGETDEGGDRALCGEGQICHASAGADAPSCRAGCRADADCPTTAPLCDTATLTCRVCTPSRAGLCASSRDGARCVADGGSSRCGCSRDADCGEPTRGRVCDTAVGRCIDGCYRASGRNGCPVGRYCSTRGADRGECRVTCAFDEDCPRAQPVCAAASGADTGCVECVRDAHCAGRSDGRVRCVGEGHSCAQCSATDTSACRADREGSRCAEGLCGCNTDEDCASDRRCDDALHRCVARVAPPPTSALSGDGCSCAVPGRAPSRERGGVGLGLLIAAAVARGRRRRVRRVGG